MTKEIKTPTRRNKLRSQIMKTFGSYSLCAFNTGIDISIISRLVKGYRDPTDYQVEIFKVWGIKFE